LPVAPAERRGACTSGIGASIDKRIPDGASTTGAPKAGRAPYTEHFANISLALRR
jgi:hypothetical protein